MAKSYLKKEENYNNKASAKKWDKLINESDDANLIEKGGVVTEKDDSLVALSNGCICCNLKMDLVGQIKDLID